MSVRIVIIDYGVGNVGSVLNAVTSLGYKNVEVSSKADVIALADYIILPGVGAFKEAMRRIREIGLVKILNHEVLVKRKPILGICLGMQIMATSSLEDGCHEGFNWIEGTVRPLKSITDLSIPHVGWNNLEIKENFPLFPQSTQRDFYFDHSYHFDCDKIHISSYVDYGNRIVASIQKDNIYGVQFHPEKSQTAGLKLFRYFFQNAQLNA